MKVTKIQKKCCGQCLFGKSKIVSDDRKSNIIEETLIDDTYFICHKASMKDQDVMCKGFYERYGYGRANQMLDRMGLLKLEFVEVD